MIDTLVGFLLNDMDKTIIYITNNVLDDKIMSLCKKNILSSIGDSRLISVSQEPMNFGENICVGKLPASSLSINIQMMEGLKRVKTDFVAIAEHDVLYTSDHFSFVVPDKNTFYYNENVWCLQYYSEDKPEFNGTFSFFKKRKANSQLICGTEIMIKATQDRIDLMSDPEWLKRYPTGRIGEAGVMDYDHAMRLSKYKDLVHMQEKLKNYCFKYKAENWNSKIPNVDIRHNSNLTKNRRGSKRRYTIPFWGKMEDILK